MRTLASEGPSSVEWNWGRTRGSSSTSRLYASTGAAGKDEGTTGRTTETECRTKCCSWTGRYSDGCFLGCSAL